MANWCYANPVAIHFGPGSATALRGILGARGAVLLTFPEAREIGLVDRVRRLIGEQIVAVVEATQVNPDVDGLVGLYEAFWQRHASCEVIVAVGGGSVLDTAKVLATGTEDGSFDSLLVALSGGATRVPPRRKRLIAVPTTAGTGSEVTRWATVWHRAAGRKYSLDFGDAWPEAAVVDPELALSLPAAPTLASGLDALSHALESLWNVHANPVSDVHAIMAAREVLATLPALMERPGDVELRQRMALAALRAGLAFSNTRTALAHSISYEMTLGHGLAHGIACSFTLPLVLRRAIGASAARDAAMAQVFDNGLDGAPELLEAFLEGLGVATRFEDYGVARAESERLIAAAMQGVRGKNFIGTPPAS